MTTFWQKVWRWVLGEPISSAPAPTFSPPKTSQPKPKPVPPPPKPPTRTIITGTGDTLFALAKKHRTTVQAIARLNRIRPQTPLRAGQRLVIPDFDAGNMAASAPETDFIAPKNTPLKQPAPPRAATRPPKRPFPQKIPPAPAKKPAAPKPAPEKPFVPPPMRLPRCTSAITDWGLRRNGRRFWRGWMNHFSTRW